MRKVRQGMFETNSSMVHAICICTPEEWEKFEDGELLWNHYSNEMKEEIDPLEDDEDEFWSYDRWDNEDWFEPFKQETTLTNGQKVVAFGYYGHD